ncbi:class II aaRS and biotin synthetase [Acephala macrosclerotiorum]|nr:class II aaRS and biotin synthetase [Acephala macrosclerotiorum]
MRAVRILQRARASHAVYRVSRIQGVIRNSYCTACEAPASVAAPAPAPSPERKAEVNGSIPPVGLADHRQLAIEQEIFTTSPYSPGSPLFLPNGAKLFNKLTNFLRAQYDRYGFQEVITPTIYKKSLWEKSGHWENYAEDMYAVTGRGASGEKEGRQIGEHEEYGLKPMNCPGHCLLFAAQKRSYRDLPIRFADFSPLHRNEIHGALSGLTRVRRFHQDDGHIFCRPSQIREEISKTLDFVKTTYETFGLGPYRLALSTRPTDNFIGTLEDWDAAEKALKDSLNESGQVWTINEGDGAFYGPKIDIILKDSDGKEHQTATIQLDFQLPQRFGLEYQAPAPEQEQRGLTTNDPALLKVEGPVTPVLIHRAVLGSVERIMALLIEHYNGRWPYWLNPRQVIIITTNDSKEVVDWAYKVKRSLQGTSGIRSWSGAVLAGDKISVDIDSTPRSVKKKVSEAKRKRYAVVAVVGNQDVPFERVVADFSGIPDPQGSLLHSGILRQISAQRKGAKGAGFAGDGKKADAKGLPPLTRGELGKFEINPGWLKRFLEGLQQSYFYDSRRSADPVPYQGESPTRD